MSAPCVAGRAFTVRVAADMRKATAAGRFDPTTETVGLRGGTAPLSWGASVPMRDPDGDGVYETTVRFGACGACNSVVAYKFKVDGAKNPDDGWEHGPNRPLVLCSGTAAVTRAFDDAPTPFPRTVTGDVRYHRAFASKYVPARDVVVLLPAGYDRAPKRRYPVLYMHDGQNVFDASTAFASEWCLDETSRRLIARHAIEPVIVVGVYNTPERIDEYTPTRIKQADRDREVEMGGKADLYGKFLVEELKPFVDRTYRTMKDAADTALGGSSLGGLVSMYLGLAYPEVFGNLLVVSPSVWWDDELIVGRVKALGAKPALRVWLDVGTAEGDGAAEQARHLRDALVAKGWKPGVDLAYVEAPGAGHDESAWAARVEPMLRFLYAHRRETVRIRTS